MDKDSVMDELRAFVASRDWGQFHTPQNLAKSISIEAAELLELFQWDDNVDSERVQDELADVLTYCFLLAQKQGLVPEDIIRQKLEVTKAKYPVDKAKGSSAKYGQL
jgi:NTP pyrophosphatase (non-canonical NTP hydrolase)